ncbi:MAG: tRNA lysidine(34) synthetase TilS [Bacteroidales bacterium]|nr:tRNA lysidine(34) synthetase TilS [Bacteroidales bacterium]
MRMDKGKQITKKVLERVTASFRSFCMSPFCGHPSCYVSGVSEDIAAPEGCCSLSPEGCCLFNPGGCNILLAVSGGVDSSVLADVIYKLYPDGISSFMSDNGCCVADAGQCGSGVAGAVQCGSGVADSGQCGAGVSGAVQCGSGGKDGRIGVAHVNFHLRGEDSNHDQEFVRNLSLRYGFEFYTADFDTLAYASAHKLSVEVAARELRYNWFCDIAAKHGFDLLLTAHNANDNAETLLLNLVRGTGRRGLGGIRPYGQLKHTGRGAESQKSGKEPLTLNVLRPLLQVERSEIEAYAKENHLDFCIDRTNSQNEYSRNKIRNQVIPLLKEINPSVVQTLGREISRFRELNSQVDKLVRTKVESLLVDSGSAGGCGIVEALRRKYLVFRASAEKLVTSGSVEAHLPGGTEANLPESAGFCLAELFRYFDIPLSEDGLESIVSCLETETHTTKTLDTKSLTTKIVRLENHTATIERGELRLYKFHKSDIPPVEIKAAGVYPFGPFSIKLEETEASLLDKDSVKGLSVLDAGNVRFPLVCRLIREGDRFSPFGLHGSKKVADFLNSRKVDLLFKSILPAITDRDGKIVCLPSLEIDDRFRVTSLSKKLLVVSASIAR